MIVFEGEVTDKDCLLFLKKRQILMFISIYIVSICITCPIIILLAIVIDKILYYFIIFPVLVVFLMLIRIKIGAPVKVTVSADYVCAYGKTKEATSRVPFDSVLEVIDMGAWYKFKYNLTINVFTVCQKDLIVEGTLEEFEELFADKLVRKTPEEQSSIQ